MANQTALEYTFEATKALLTGANVNEVNPEHLASVLSAIGETFLKVKKSEDGTAPQQVAPAAKAVQPSAAPSTPVVEAKAKAVEAPAAKAEAATPPAPVAQSQPAPVVVAEKRKPGRPKGSGKKVATVSTAQAVAPAPVAEVASDTVVSAQVADDNLVYDNPDPKAPNYKFKHLLDRFGTNPDGSAKRFNNLSEEDTFDGEMVISLFDGTKRKMLKRHLGTEYQMTDKEYATHFGLSKGYRPVGRDFSASKSVDAKKTGLGLKTEAKAEQVEEKPIATPAKAVRRTRTRTAQSA